MTNKQKLKIIIKQYKRSNKKFFLQESLKAMKWIFHIANEGDDAEEKLLWTINLLSGIYGDDIKEIRKATKRIVIGYAKNVKEHL